MLDTTKSLKSFATKL